MMKKLQSHGDVGKENDHDKSKIKSSNRIGFKDVAGIDAAKAELEEVVDALKNPAKYRAIGAKIPRGTLLCGPSGTGKTLLARALASEADIPFMYCSASDFVEMLVGRGAARVRQLFIKAAKCAPSIIFIDELDALAKARGGLNSNDEREQTLNQLLTEMDGFDARSEGVFVLAATNRPQILDPALCRPGRFDRHVYVGLPDVNGREAILQVHTRKVRLSQHVSLRKVALATPGRSGADLASLVNDAALLAVRSCATTVDTVHFEEAITRSTRAKALHTTPSSLFKPAESLD